MISQRKGATAGVAAAALLALSLTTGFGGTPRSTPPTEPAASGSAAGGGGDFVIGVSNTLAGNGWREEMICAVKAQALASGEVSKVIAISSNGGPTEQIQDLQNLISQGVNAIIVNPSDREQLNPVIEEAIAQGIVVVAVDQAVTAEGAYVATNDQVAYGRLGAQWLADALGGEGTVLYMRGIEGVPADDDRNTASSEVMASYPDIKLKEVFTGWDYTQGGDIAVQELTAADYDGIWTSGIDYTVVNAFETVGKDPVPVVGADNNEFINQLHRRPARRRWSPTRRSSAASARRSPSTPSPAGARAGDAAHAAGVGRSQNNMAELEANYFPDRDADVQLGGVGGGLHHLHARAAVRLQGPRRVDRATTTGSHRRRRSIRSSGAGSSGCRTVNAPLTRSEPPLPDEPATGPPRCSTAAVAKSFGTVVALRASTCRRRRARCTPCSAPTAPASRRWSRSSPACCAPTPAPSPSHGRAGRCCAGRPTPRRCGLAPVFQDPALVPRPHRRPEPAPHRRRHRRRARPSSPAMDLDGLDLGEQVRDVPLPFLRMLDLARALVVRPAAAAARRDHRRPAARPVRAGVRRDAPVEGARPLGAVHLPPAGRGPRALRHVHRAARRPQRRLVRARRGRRGADRRGDARRGRDRWCARRRASGRRRRPAATAARASRPAASAPAASSTTSRLAVAPGEVLGLAALEGQGQEHAVRHPRRQPPGRPRRAR